MFCALNQRWPRPNTELALRDIFTKVVTEVGRAGQYGNFDAVDLVREEGMTEVWW